MDPLSQALAIAQLAVSLVILIAASLFVRTLSNFESIDLGFNRENVLTLHLNARQAGHKGSEIPGFYEQLRARFASIPGVRSASLSDMPLIGVGQAMTMVGVGRPANVPSLILNVGTNFFGAMQIPILRSREIAQKDLADLPGPLW